MSRNLGETSRFTSRAASAVTNRSCDCFLESPVIREISQSGVKKDAQLWHRLQEQGECMNDEFSDGAARARHSQKFLLGFLQPEKSLVLTWRLLPESWFGTSELFESENVELTKTGPSVSVKSVPSETATRNTAPSTVFNPTTWIWEPWIHNNLHAEP